MRITPVRIASTLLLLCCVWLVAGTPTAFEKRVLENCLDYDDVDEDDFQITREQIICSIVAALLIGGAPRGASAEAFLNGGEATGAGGEVYFEPNVGQADRDYRFTARAGQMTAFFNAGGMAIDLRDGLNAPVAIRARFLSANAGAEAEPLDLLPGRVNYLYGSDSSKWVTDVPVYRRIQYRDVFPGTDVVYYGKDGWIEHDFVVRPGHDPHRIEIALEGADEVRVDSKGDLKVKAGRREITWKRPDIYQQIGGRRRVEGRFRMTAANRFGFEVGPYRTNLPLVIDPVVSYSTFLGRTSTDGGARVAADANGNAYLVGFTFDQGFPVSPGAVTPRPGSAEFGNPFLVKMSSAGQMVYSTHFGGSFLDGSVGVAVDTAGNAYVAGATRSQDFPLTASPIKPVFIGPNGARDSMDCFVTKFNAAGNALLYSTYLGTDGSDSCTAIAVDAQGSAYVAGWTRSSQFPTSESAPQRQNRGEHDVFVAKLNPAGSALVWSTLLGGVGPEEPSDIAVDGQGNVYITGGTASGLGFPVTAGAFQRTYGATNAQSVVGAGDAFVAKINANGAAFGYVTYLGGNADDIGGSIDVDAQGNAYVSGSTLSANFPVTAQALRNTFQGAGGNTIFPGGDGFVTKLNPAGSALVWSTFLGGSRDDWASALAVDPSGNVWVAGATLSTNFPVTQDASQRTHSGGDPEANLPTGDAFLAQIHSSGTSLIYSTFLGGERDEYALGVAVTANDVFVSGTTRSRNFPTTAGSAQPSYGGETTAAIPLGDAFLTRITDTGTGGGGASNVSLASVGSAASYVGGSVAPGEIVVLGGTNIGPGTLTTLAVQANAVTSLLSETRVLFDGAAAPLIYVSAAQSAAIVPYAVASRAATDVVVEYRGARSAVVRIPVARTKPSLFSANSSGRGPGAILNENSSVNSAANPANKGSIVQLFGTGEGQTNPPGIDGRLAITQFPRPVDSVSVTIDGATADVLYAGAAPGQVAGLIQINAKVPESVASGPREVIWSANGVRSQTGLTVAVR